MPDMCLDQYEALTKLIDKINMDYMCELAMDAFGGQGRPKTQEQIRARTSREKTSTVALRALRLLLNAELLAQGKRQFQAQFKEDFHEVADSTGWLLGIWQDSDALISETVELILLAAGNRRNSFLSQLRSQLGILPGRSQSCDPDIFSTGLGMLSVYLEYQLVAEAVQAAQGLIALSNTRCVAAPQLHREVIVRCLGRLVDTEPQSCQRICVAQEHLFVNKVDDLSAEFFWFYAYVSYICGNPEAAMPLFLRSNKLWCMFEGENSWLGARSMEMYHRARLHKDGSPKSEAFLWDFIRKAEAGFFPGAGNAATIEAAFLRYELLAWHMEKQNLSKFFDQLQRHLALCTAHEAAICNPRLTVRSATNMLSAYYLEKGQYLQAEEKMRDAFHTIPPEGVAKMPSDDLILSNLLQIYFHMNDCERMEQLAALITEKLEDGSIPEAERTRCSVLVQSVYTHLGYDMTGLVDEFRDNLDNTYNVIRKGDTKELEQNGASYAYGIVSRIAAVLDTFSSSQKELLRYEAILMYFLERLTLFTFNDNQLMVIYQELARIYWQQKSKKTFAALEKSLAYARRLLEFSPSRITNLRIAAIIYHDMKQMDNACAIAEEAIAYIAGAWHNVVAYIDDHRICRILETAQSNYNTFYALLRSQKTAEYIYDQLLRYKDLPALVGRERNRQLNDAGINKELLSRIYQLQDTLANAQLSDALDSEAVYEELQKAEAAFVRHFPQQLQYTPISIQQLGDRLKEHEAVIEYYFTPNSTSILGSTEHAAWELDVFVLTKLAGRLRLSHTVLSNGDRILEDAAAFIDILQNGEESEHIREQEMLREKLYRNLLSFALSKCAHAKTLYIAPDLELCNLPFEILYADHMIELQERFQICRLVCGRDLLFFDTSSCGRGKPFILGGPDFDAEKGSVFKDYSRNLQKNFEAASSLPFSGIEAKRIAERCHVKAFVGRDATKYALRKALPCSIIHLATHGVFDESMESDSLYSSYLLFAGYNHWLSTKDQSDIFGNGILTADEISRMDLRNTELVVLSACNSGMGSYSQRSVKGFLSAFSAAGVRWVISHIWKVDDFATPILMDAFYSAYLRDHLEVPKALQYAKNYLRSVSIGELRRAGWLNPSDEHLLTPEIQDSLQMLRQENDRWKPFMDESHWGGFVCYKCK